MVCALALVLGSVTAKAETTGVYVAPKFLMMWQNNDAKMDNGIEVGYISETVETSKFNSQFTLGGALAVGYDFYSQFKLPIRAELEFAMRGDNKFNADSEHPVQGVVGESKFLTNASTLMANFFYDFRNDSAFTPYVTAGAGLAFIRAECEMTDTLWGNGKLLDESETFTNFAWNVGAGVAYNFNENVAVDLGYRYVNMGNVSMSGSKRLTSRDTASYDMDANLSSHEVALGIRYTF